MIYMLNLIFDVTEPNAVLNGRFQPYVAPQGATPDYLQCSKVWLKSPYGNNYDVSNEWTWMQEDTGAPLTLQGGEQGDQIVVRVLGLNTPTDNTNGNLTWLTRLTVVVSRDTPRAIKDNATPPKPYQTRASPFPMSGPLTEPCVLYDFENHTYQTGNNELSPGATSTSWIQPLGLASLTTEFQSGTPKPENYFDAYAVIVAVTVGQGSATGQDTDPTRVMTFSHDPDMNVQC